MCARIWGATVKAAVSIVIFLNLPPDRFSGKSGGDPDARAQRNSKEKAGSEKPRLGRGATKW